MGIKSPNQGVQEILNPFVYIDLTQSKGCGWLGDIMIPQHGVNPVEPQECFEIQGFLNQLQLWFSDDNAATIIKQYWLPDTPVYVSSPLPFR